MRYPSFSITKGNQRNRRKQYYILYTALFLTAIPYSHGWTHMSMGKVRHFIRQIELEHHTPFLKTGICIFLLAILFDGIYVYLLEKKH